MNGLRQLFIRGVCRANRLDFGDIPDYDADQRVRIKIQIRSRSHGFF